MTTRTLDPRNLEKALRAAQVAFAARGVGEAETWVLPQGRYVIEAPLALGADGLILTLRGAGRGAELHLGQSAALSLVGARLQVEGLRITAARGVHTGLAARASMSLRVSGVFVSGLSANGDLTGLSLQAPDVRLANVGVSSLSSENRVRGIAVQPGGKIQAEKLRIGEIRGSEVLAFDGTGASEVRFTGLAIGTLRSDGPVTGARIGGTVLTLKEATVSDLKAGGPALGLSLAATGTAIVGDLRVFDLTGAGAPGLPFDDLDGDGALGLWLAAPAGRLERVTIGTLTALAGRDIALRLPADFPVQGLSVARSLDGGDLAAALASAQAALEASPAGAVAEWSLPAGDFHLAAGLALGAAGRGLTLRGAPKGRGSTRLSFEAQGGGPVAGDLTALELTGTELSLTALGIDARATGFLTALAMTATTTALCEGVSFGPLRAGTTTGVTVDAPSVTLRDLAGDDIGATAGHVIGLALTGGDAAIAGLSLSGLAASGDVTGISTDMTAGASFSAARINGLTGRIATGLLARVSGGAPGIISALDVRLSGLEARAGGDMALGAAILCRGDVELRALGTKGLLGERALGVLIAATGSVDWLAGETTDIQGHSTGAAGARIVVAAQPARDDGTPGIALRDLVVEAVRGANPSGQSAPADSWLTLGPELAEALIVGGVAALPGPGTAGHTPEVTGLSVTAPVSDFAEWLGGQDPGSLTVESCLVRRVTGTAVQFDAALRDVSLRGTEVWTASNTGWIDAERVLLANLTVHHVGHGLDCTTSDVTAVNSLFTATDNGPGLFVGLGGDLNGGTSWASLGSAPLAPEPDPLPYVASGPTTPVPATFLAGTLTPATDIDLSLLPGNALDPLAEPVPGDAPGAPVWIGASQPRAGGHCVFADPDPPPALAPLPAPEPSPFVDYVGRDGSAFLATMMARAGVVMPEWTTRTAGDFTTMLMEMLASEMDLVAYRQEEAVANGYLSTATLWRALEDHARLVDHMPDRGHSASAMLRFEVTDAAALGLEADFAAGGTLEIPRGTLVVNPDADALSLVFATEATLAYDPLVASLDLVEDSVILSGGLTARVAGDLAPRLAGRWLVVEGTGPDGEDLPRHVVRVVSVEQGADSTLIAWDPRRPAPAEYAAGRCTLRGNVVPGHHGVPLEPLAPGVEASATAADPLAPWRAMMTLEVTAPTGRLAEVTLPVGPVSRHRSGWPLPDEAPSIGAARIAATLDGIPLALVEDLSAETGGAPTMSLRSSRAGRPGLAIASAGDGGRLELALSVGLGAIGNVGRGALTRVLTFGPGSEIEMLLPGRADRLDVLSRAIAVTNDLPATGGRDPDGIETIRATAPLAHRRALSAVAPRDYERLLEAMDEVGAARASVIDTGLGRTVLVTALMTGEDTLTLDELAEAREAERLRRWALTRRRLAEIRLMGFDVELVPPDFVPLDIDLAVDIADWASADRVQRGVEAALRDDGGLFDPDRSGLGRDVTPDAIQRAVLAVEGVTAVRILRLRRLAPGAQDYARAIQMPIGATEVAVLARPFGGPDGVLTVTTCGGMA
ncbi:hypothetical protein [Mesorhizobium sp. CN2-181]|uniref:hypothetical protein n=1 Tax=Mesorhizobium yinganensis TaxID=3157707 RepID=UPI0032B75D48